jgi:hypothetical protein
MIKIVFLIFCSVAALFSQAQSNQNFKSGDNTTINESQDSYNQIISDYKGPCGCSNPITNEELKQTISIIKTRNSDVWMLTLAKQEIRNKCLLATQIKEITLLFTYDDTRYNFVAFAQTYTYDLGNYRADLQQFLFPTVSTKFGQTYTKNALNKLWVNPSYSAETVRHFYSYGY